MVNEGTRAETGRGEAVQRFADDEFYRALAARHRRRALAHLLSCNRCTVDELVDVLCGWEAATDSIVDASRAKQLRIEMVHRHLPVLAEAGLVSYDRPADEVAIEPLSDAVERLIRRSVDAE